MISTDWQGFAELTGPKAIFRGNPVEYICRGPPDRGYGKSRVKPPAMGRRLGRGKRHHVREVPVAEQSESATARIAITDEDKLNRRFMEVLLLAEGMVPDPTASTNSGVSLKVIYRLAKPFADEMCCVQA